MSKGQEFFLLHNLILENPDRFISKKKPKSLTLSLSHGDVVAGCRLQAAKRSHPQARSDDHSHI